MEYVLVLFGSFVSLLLMINAYFTRKTLEKISSVELRLVEYTTKHDATDERSKENKKELDRVWERLHSLEGGQGQLLVWLESQK
jgi:hypothetical protein